MRSKTKENSVIKEKMINKSERIGRGKKVQIAAIYIRLGLILVFLALFYSYIHLKAYGIIVFDPIFRGTKSLYFKNVNDIYSSDLIKPGLIAADSFVEKKSSGLLLSAIAISGKSEQNRNKIRVVIDFIYTGKDSDNGHPTNALCIRYSPFFKKIILIDRDVNGLIPALRESKYFISNGIENENIFKAYENGLSHCNLSNAISDMPTLLPISIVLLINDSRSLYGCALFFPVLDTDNAGKSKSLRCVTIQKEISKHSWDCRTTNDSSYPNIRDIEPIEAIKMAYYKLNDNSK
jgi:hypothetical protein